MRDPLFLYGTLKHGHSNHAVFAPLLGEALGRVSTAVCVPLVVPRRPFCVDPTCGLVHRYPALVDRPGSGFRVAGELYAVDGAALAALDRFEGCAPEDEADPEYLRRRVQVEPEGGGAPRDAWVYFIADAALYLGLVAAQAADVVPCYSLDMDMTLPKPCCAAAPGHRGLHDAVAPE